MKANLLIVHALILFLLMGDEMDCVKTERARLPDYLFISSDGALYDTRRENWNINPPLRAVYRRHYGAIENTKQLRACIREGAACFPGGYETAFFTSDGAHICHKCARENYSNIAWSIRAGISDGWQVVGLEALYGEGDIYCDNCGVLIDGEVY